MPGQKRTRVRTKPRTLKPLDQITAKGRHAFVLEVKNNRAVVQFEDGKKTTVPVSECQQPAISLGRPPKPDKNDWMQVSVFLRKDTVEKLRSGGNSRYFGAFLEEHLERYPLPSREQYLDQKVNKPYIEPLAKPKRRIPVIMGTVTPKLQALL